MLSIEEGMDEFEALKAVTINPALILGINDRVGSIEMGKDADIVIMNGYPFDTFSTTDMILVDGEIAYNLHSSPPQKTQLRLFIHTVWRYSCSRISN